MSKKPRRVQINGKWYDAREGWCKLELSEYMGPVKYTANEPYAHMNDFYFVYDVNGSKVGEIDINNRSYSGSVTGFEM